MTEINVLVARLAMAYLTERGSYFTHLGVRLPLAPDVLELAMQNNIVGALLERAGSQQGQENALLMLRHMLVGDQLTALGCQVLDEMNRAFCAEVREMLDQGKDPAVELTQESKRRPMQ